MKEDNLQNIKPQNVIKFQNYEKNEWQFYHSIMPMLSTKELDQVSDQVGTMGMPDVFYGKNRIFMIKKDRNFIYYFDPKEALSLCAFQKQKKYLKSSQQQDQAALSAEEILNQINLIPKGIEVSQAKFWKKKDLSKVKDFKQIEIISDWTYSTTYKGSVYNLSNKKVQIKNETSLDIDLTEEQSQIQNNIIVEETKDQIPIERLGKDNPILYYAEIFLYEDDLGDQGQAMCYVRYRIMNDCWFLLHRYYLRVDDVLVRIYDTRAFCSFDENVILREFQHKESTYDQLKNKGFQLNSEFSLSKTQSDEVFNHLDLKFKFLDKIKF